MQIKSLVLYNKLNLAKRVLEFNLNAVNIIVGIQATGKSSIGKIIDYCLGQTRCDIPAGVIRNNVDWYALQLEHEGNFFMIARKAPKENNESSTIYKYLFRADEIPDNLDNFIDTNRDDMVKILNKIIGIKENSKEHEWSNDVVVASIRDAMYYCFQNQGEIASEKYLFHRQSEAALANRLKDTLLYFLGVNNEEMLALSKERKQLRHELAKIKAEIRESDIFVKIRLEKARDLWIEASLYGLIEDKYDFENLNYHEVVEVFQNIIDANMDFRNSELIHTPLDEIKIKQKELDDLKHQIDNLKYRKTSLKTYWENAVGYYNEMNYQNNRLKSIGLFDKLDFRSGVCPFCSNPVEDDDVSSFIRNSIISLDANLSSMSVVDSSYKKENQRINKKIEDLKESYIRIKRDLDAVFEANESALAMKNNQLATGKIIGKISLWMESIVPEDVLAKKRKEKENIEKRLDEIEEILGAANIDSLMNNIISIIQSDMTNWASKLELEYAGKVYSLDYKKITLMVYGDKRPIPLKELGSGANILACHLITLFALHKYFNENHRPVPRFLFLDQPSQVYFPGAVGIESTDDVAVKRLYDFMFKVVNEYIPGLQLIIVEHADLNDDKYQNSIVERWNEKNGVKLIPSFWY